MSCWIIIAKAIPPSQKDADRKSSIIASAVATAATATLGGAGEGRLPSGNSNIYLWKMAEIRTIIHDELPWNMVIWCDLPIFHRATLNNQRVKSQQNGVVSW